MRRPLPLRVGDMPPSIDPKVKACVELVLSGSSLDNAIISAGLDNSESCRRKIRRHVQNRQVQMLKEAVNHAVPPSLTPEESAKVAAEAANEMARVARVAAAKATASAMAAQRAATKKVKPSVSDVGGRRTRNQVHNSAIFEQTKAEARKEALKERTKGGKGVKAGLRHHGGGGG